MTRFVSIALVLALGALAYLLAGQYRGRSRHAEHGDPLGWLKAEFALTDEQLRVVQTLHEDYLPKCAEMCQRIGQANAEVARLSRVSRGMTPELERAIDEAQRCHADCHKAMLTHVYQTASLMPPSRAERYLQTVTAKILRGGESIDEVMGHGSTQ